MMKSSEACFKMQKVVSRYKWLSIEDEQMENGRRQEKGIPSSQNPQESN